MTHKHLIDPEEVEVYEGKEDIGVIITIMAIVVALVIIIGEWIF